MTDGRRKVVRSYEVKAHYFERVESSMIVEAASADEAREQASRHFSQISDDYSFDSVMEINRERRVELETVYRRRMN